MTAITNRALRLVTNKLYGRGAAAGDLLPEEISLGFNLSFTGTTLNSASPLPTLYAVNTTQRALTNSTTAEQTIFNTSYDTWTLEADTHYKFMCAGAIYGDTGGTTKKFQLGIVQASGTGVEIIQNAYAGIGVGSKGTSNVTGVMPLQAPMTNQVYAPFVLTGWIKTGVVAPTLVPKIKYYTTDITGGHIAIGTFIHFTGMGPNNINFWDYDVNIS